MTANENAIAAETARATSAEADLGDRITTNRGNITSNTTRIGNNESAIATNRTATRTNRGLIDQNISDIAGLDSRVATNESDIAALQQNFASGTQRLERKIEQNAEGVAIALSLAGTGGLSSGKNFRLSGNWGNFEGTHAFSIGATMRLSPNALLSGGVGYGTQSSSVGARAGVALEW